MVGLDDIRGLFQPKWFFDFIINIMVRKTLSYWPVVSEDKDLAACNVNAIPGQSQAELVWSRCIGTWRETRTNIWHFMHNETMLDNILQFTSSRIRKQQAWLHSLLP